MLSLLNNIWTWLGCLKKNQDLKFSSQNSHSDQQKSYTIFSFNWLAPSSLLSCPQKSQRLAKICALQMTSLWRIPMLWYCTYRLCEGFRLFQIILKLFAGHFRPLLKWAVFVRQLGSSKTWLLSLKPNHYCQVKLVQIPEAHVVRVRYQKPEWSSL